jgi:hypothetical protein
VWHYTAAPGLAGAMIKAENWGSPKRQMQESRGDSSTHRARLQPLLASSMGCDGPHLAPVGHSNESQRAAGTGRAGWGREHRRGTLGGWSWEGHFGRLGEHALGRSL